MTGKDRKGIVNIQMICGDDFPGIICMFTDVNYAAAHKNAINEIALSFLSANVKIKQTAFASIVFADMGSQSPRITIIFQSRRLEAITKGLI